MFSYKLNKNDIKRKLDYFFKKSNLSLELLKNLDKKQIYKLFKLLNSSSDNKHSNKELKIFVSSILEYIDTQKINEKIDGILNLKKTYSLKERFINIIETIVSIYISYFFDKKQIIRI